MSQWHTVEDADISVDIGEVDILVCQNDSGNVYLTLTFDQVRRILKEIERVGG